MTKIYRLKSAYELGKMTVGTENIKDRFNFREIYPRESASGIQENLENFYTAHHKTFSEKSHKKGKLGFEIHYQTDEDTTTEKNSLNMYVLTNNEKNNATLQNYITYINDIEYGFESPEKELYPYLEKYPKKEEKQMTVTALKFELKEDVFNPIRTYNQIQGSGEITALHQLIQGIIGANTDVRFVYQVIATPVQKDWLTRIVLPFTKYTEEDHMNEIYNPKQKNVETEERYEENEVPIEFKDDKEVRDIIESKVKYGRDRNPKGYFTEIRGLFFSKDEKALQQSVDRFKQNMEKISRRNHPKKDVERPLQKLIPYHPQSKNEQLSLIADILSRKQSMDTNKRILTKDPFWKRILSKQRTKPMILTPPELATVTHCINGDNINQINVVSK